MPEEITEIMGHEGRLSSIICSEATYDFVAKKLKQEKSSQSVKTVVMEAKSILEASEENNVDGSRRTVLAIGYVQSGKTLSFSTVLSLAKDNKYNLAIVLSGTKKNLQEQTTKRLREDLEGIVSVVKTETKTNWFDNLENKFEKAQKFESEHCLGVISCLKQKDHLRDLIKRLANAKQLFDLKRILIIDDEADQASLDGNKSDAEAEEPTTTYGLIEKLRGLADNHCLIQYTATPEALLLLEEGDNLSPNAIRFVSPGNGYTGGATFFNPAYGLAEFIPSSEQEDFHDADIPPESISKAIAHFLVGLAISKLRGDLNNKIEDNRSLMFHPDMRKDKQRSLEVFVKNQIRIIRDSFDTDEDKEETRKLCLERYQKISAVHDQIGSTRELPNWDTVWPEIHALSYDLKSYVVNSEQFSTEIDYESHDQVWILIGGQKLERGFTVEGLSVTHVLRRSSKNQDTQQQWARQFGYREDYLDTSMMFMTEQLYQEFEAYLNEEAFLRLQLQKISAPGGNLPEDFRKVRRSLLVTRGKKPTRSNVVPVDADSPITQKINERWNDIFQPEHDAAKKNLQAIRGFVETLDAKDFGYKEWIEFSGKEANADLVWTADQVIPRYSLGMNPEDLIPFLSGLEFSGVMGDKLRVLEFFLQNKKTMKVDVFWQGQRERNIEKFQLYQGSNAKTGYPGMREFYRGDFISLQIFEIKDNQGRGLYPAIGFKAPDSEFTIFSR